MSRAIPYSGARDDLYFPCKRGEFFAGGLPATEAALCAEMSRLAYCHRADGFAFDQVKIAGVLGDIGFTKSLFFESAGQPQGGGTHCFLAIRDDADPAKQLAVVAFRGTDKDDPTDLGDDGDILHVDWPKGGRVHGGFERALEEVTGTKGIDSALASVRSRLLFTGHSLGAALATLLASLRNPSVLFTFGSPRVGDAAFVATLEAVDSRRYVDCCDLVARLPLEIMAYSHKGQPYYIDHDGTVTLNPDDGFLAADQLHAREDYLLEYAWKDGNVAIRDLADHAPLNYVSAGL